MRLTYSHLKKIIKNEIKFLNETWSPNHTGTLNNVLTAFDSLSKNISDMDSLKTLKLTKSFLAANNYIDPSDMELFLQFEGTKEKDDFNKLKKSVVPKLQDAMRNLQAEE